MPLYEYRRPDGSTFEIRQLFTEEALTHDPDDATIPVVRVIHIPSIHFKGSGFYTTDYKNKSKKDPPTDKPTPTPIETKEKADADQSSTPDKST